MRCPQRTSRLPSPVRPPKPDAWESKLRKTASGQCLPIAKGPLDDCFQYYAAVRQRWGNDRRWPIPAVQAMKSTRGCPTATCDPKQTS